MEVFNIVQISQILIAIAAAIIVGFYIIPIVIKIAVKKDLVAKPNHRTSHTGRIPNIGGVAIFIAFVISFLFTANEGITIETQYVILATIILFFVGLNDDILVISPRRKLLGQVIAILAVITLGNIRFTNLHGFFGVYELHYLASVLLTGFVAVVIINALNLIDGIDGLAAGIGMVVSTFFTFYFYISGDASSHIFAVLSACLLGALIPFFAYNVFAKRNKIFMGDAGALVLGLIVAVLTIKFTELNITSLGNAKYINNAPVVALCILVIPMFDTIRVFTIRIASGKSPFTPDKNHLHHLLIGYGFKHKIATLILVIINLLYIIVGLACQNLNIYLFFVLIFFSALGLSEGFNVLVKAKRKRDLQNNTSILNNQTN